LTLVFGFSVLPLLQYLIAIAAGVPLSRSLLLVVGTVINLGGLLALATRRRRRGPASGRRKGSWLDVGPRDTAAVAAAALASTLLLVFGLRFLNGEDAFATVHHCMHAIVMHTLSNDPSGSVALYDGAIGAPVHFLVHSPGVAFNGLAPLFREQRLGNGALIAPAVAFLGSAGWLAAAMFASLVTAVCTWLACREAGARPSVAAVAAALFVCGTHVFCSYGINENFFAVALVAFLLWTALRREISLGWAVVAGMVFGHLIGVRHTACLFGPAVVVAALWRPAPWVERLKVFAVGAAFALLATAPWLYVNAIMLGNPFSHPRLQSEHSDRVIVNSFLGLEFAFRALNWPFTPQVSRTAWNPFPTWLWLPLWAGRCYGQLALAVAALGGWLLGRRSRRLVWLLLLFAVPHCVAIAWLEELDWEQITYAAPGFVPLAVALAVGLEGLCDRAHLRRRALAVLGILAVVVLSARAIRPLEFPVDSRLFDPEQWSTPPPHDRGTRAVGRMLTRPAILPALPALQRGYAGFLWNNMAHVIGSSDVPRGMGGLPVYPSGQVSVLAGSEAEQTTPYEFILAGGPPRSVDAPVRTGDKQCLIALLLAADQVRVQIVRRDQRYQVEIEPLGLSGVARDFTIRLSPWWPPVRSIDIQTPTGPILGLRTLVYGEYPDGEVPLQIVTNYPPHVLDTVEVPFVVDPGDEPIGCGVFIFYEGEGTSRIETFMPKHGHIQDWRGELSGHVTLPRNVLADEVLLFNDPYCSSHVPQYGDRYGRAHGPFTPDRVLSLALDQMW